MAEESNPGTTYFLAGRACVRLGGGIDRCVSPGCRHRDDGSQAPRSSVDFCNSAARFLSHFNDIRIDVQKAAKQNTLI